MRLLLRHGLILGLAFFQANPSRAFTQEVYVWQRQFSPAVYEALDAVRDDVAGSAILVAEINWNGSRPHLFRSSVDYAALAAFGRPVGLVLRLGPYAGPFTSDDDTVRYLAELSGSLIKTARAGGLEPAELQIDFDCASSKLAGYRRWLETLRSAIAPMKIVFTALPDWLARPDFPDLAHATGGYILQVHSLEKPTGPDENFQLCDPDRAWKWIEQAGRIGVAFRVALPTYGYRLAFDPSGKFIALAAEGAVASWPEGTQIRTVGTDARSMAGLEAKLTRKAPADCTGIIWFRLPVPGDQLNWSLTTLKVVLRGGLPVSRLVAEVNWSAQGLVEVSVLNCGEQDELLPAKVVARWSNGEPMHAADGLGGYSLASDPAKPSVITLAAANISGVRLAPGRSRQIGWMRFSHEILLNLQIAASP